MKILFIEPYPIEGPSSRYRVEQYLPYFRDNGIRCAVRPFMSSGFYKIIYKRGFYFRKALLFLQASFRRFLDLFTAFSYDIIFIHLEAFPLGPPIFEWVIYLFGKKIIYDLDDAIYMGITSPSNSFLKFLKYPAKVKKIIQMSRHVITCNAYLADYAKKYNKNVTAIHTLVDTEKFIPKMKDNGQSITIGWIGSHSTTRYLEQLKDVFIELSARYKFILKIVGSAGYNIKIQGAKVINMDWSLKDEIEQFQSLDIGVYPLPDNEWTQGKTGFKTIQYMSVGIPCVVSDVGANRQIVQDGVNGYLARTEEEWIEKISKLIEDAGLRGKMGLAGRKTIEEKYSVKVSKDRYIEIFEKISPRI